MPNYRRYAVYFTPAPGALADFGARWLGWDIAAGRASGPEGTAGLTADEVAQLTAIPRRYGFHATLKPPFALAEGHSAAGLRDSLRAICADAAPVGPVRLELAVLGAFLALVPAAPCPALQRLAARLVRDLDPHRAPLSPADRARRNPDRLTPEQRALLDRWGYPWVMDQFRFHMTLTGPLPEARRAGVMAALRPALAQALPNPLMIDALTLVGEDSEGRFHQIARLALTGD